MACRKGKNKRELTAKLVAEADQRTPCVFCNREVDDEVIYGKLYAIGDIQIHYFCALLSCCLIQKAQDDVGLFGFLYTDILAEVERCKKHRCSYCGHNGANLGCSVSQCRKQFHLPCGRERNAVSMFYGNYKSFCQLHAPKQKIPDSIMAKVKLRMPNKKHKKDVAKVKPLDDVLEDAQTEPGQTEECMVCVICYEEVNAGPSVDTFWPPCCARDAWFHRKCLQRMALSAGMHYLKCPLCNDKDVFHRAVVEQGYYMPDRDAAWELEQNAFAEMYEREIACTVARCLCPEGRTFDSDQGEWDIKLCLLCGTQNAHAGCIGMLDRFICDVCKPAAPEDIDALADSIQAVIIQEQSRSQASHRRPVMPSRMSLRRTKQGAPQASTSKAAQIQDRSAKNSIEAHKQNTAVSRLDLNLKSPKRPQVSPLPAPQLDTSLLSPLKLLQHGLREKMAAMGAGDDAAVNAGVAIEMMRRRFKKPRPLSEKRRIINEILEGLFDNMNKESPKRKEVTKAWASPRKDGGYITDSDPTVMKVPVTPKKEFIETTIPNDNIVFIGNEKDVGEPMEVNQKETVKKVIIFEDDESTRSTFELPPEFIAADSDDSIPVLTTPQKATTIVDIRKDSSLEISEHEEAVKIDVITINDKSPENNPDLTEKCAFKFSPVDNETLSNKNVDLDVECFKNKYLNEVKKDEVKCKFGHKHTGSEVKNIKLRTAIDFAIEAAMKDKNNDEQKCLKRKLDMDEKSDNPNIPDANKNRPSKHSKKKKRRKEKKLKTKVSVHNENIKLKIQFKQKQFNLKISQSKSRNSKKKRREVVKPKRMQQYVLQYDTKSTLKEQIVKPENSVTPIKKKKVKLEKTPDNLVQTSIQSFFFHKQPNN